MSLSRPIFCKELGKVWELHKILFGLKEGAKEWHRERARVLSKMSVHRSAADPALYVGGKGRCGVAMG